MIESNRPDLQTDGTDRQHAVSGGMTAEILRAVAQLLAAIAGPSRYHFLLLWLATLRCLVFELIVDQVDWTVIRRTELTPLRRWMLVAPPQHWSAP